MLFPIKVLAVLNVAIYIYPAICTFHAFAVLNVASNQYQFNDVIDKVWSQGVGAGLG